MKQVKAELNCIEIGDDSLYWQEETISVKTLFSEHMCSEQNPKASKCEGFSISYVINLNIPFM